MTNTEKISSKHKNYFKDKTCLVTGAAGFIGSHLVETLALCGANVKAMVHYNSRSSIGNLEYIDDSIRDNIEILFGDVTDPFSVAHSVEGCSVVFHLAALIAIPYSYKAPQQYVSSNITGTLNVLEACRRYNVEKIVHTSTSETYGTARYAPIDELHPLQGQSPYSATKIGADKIAESYFLSFSLPVSTIRPFNTYGPRQSARAVIPTIIMQALTREKIHIGSLSPLRDFNYVLDTVNGFLSVAKSKKTTGEVVNIGSGKCISIGDTLSLIQKLMGTDKKVIVDDERIRPEKSEVMKLHCNNVKAKELANWEPVFDFQDGLTETINWVKNNIDIFKTNQYII